MKYAAWYQNKITRRGGYKVVNANTLTQAHKLAEKKCSKNEWYCWLLPLDEFRQSFQ
jgi:hypothetical protein